MQLLVFVRRLTFMTRSRFHTAIWHSLSLVALISLTHMVARGQANRPSSEGVQPDGSLRLGVRSIPLPQTISRQAQEYLTTRGLQPGFAFPPATDAEAWKKLAEGVRARTPSASNALRSIPATVESAVLDEARVFIGTAKTIPQNHRRRAILDFHGGGFIFGGGELVRLEAGKMAAEYECVVYAVDYRMPPEHPFPAALDDAVTIYRAMLKKFKPADIIFVGESAGGNIATAAALKIRDLKLALPAALILNSPEVDLTESGDSFKTNLGLDVLLKNSFMQANLVYAGGHDLQDPFVSPLFGDFNKGFPPVYIQSGTRDLMLSNSARFHSKLKSAGVDSILYVGEAMPHTGFGGATPEDKLFQAEQVRFMNRFWGK